MRIAVPSSDFTTVSGHAGQSRRWLVFDWSADVPDPAATRIELEKHEVFHRFKGNGPHPLDGVELIITHSAGDGFLRRMRKRNVEVLLTGESNPRAALGKLFSGEALADPRFDVTLVLCRVRDRFSSH